MSGLSCSVLTREHQRGPRPRSPFPLVSPLDTLGDAMRAVARTLVPAELRSDLVPLLSIAAVLAAATATLFGVIDVSAAAAVVAVSAALGMANLVGE